MVANDQTWFAEKNKNGEDRSKIGMGGGKVERKCQQQGAMDTIK